MILFFALAALVVGRCLREVFDFRGFPVVTLLSGAVFLYGFYVVGYYGPSVLFHFIT